MDLINKLKDYFFGSVIRGETDALERASATLVFYTLLVALVLVSVVEVSHLLSEDVLLIQHLLSYLTVVVFIGALFLVRWTGSFRPTSIIMLVFSFFILTMHMILYRDFLFVNGVHLSLNLLFSIYVLNQTQVALSVVLQVLTVGVYTLLSHSGYLDTIAPSATQPVFDQMISLVVICGLIIFLLFYFKFHHRLNSKRLQNLVLNLEEAKLAAEEMNELKSNFFANMSHEIRTPLNGIIGINHLMKDQIKDGELREYVDIQAQSGQRLLETIDGVLSLSKLESKQSLFKLKYVKINDLVAEVIDNQKAIIERKNLKVRHEIGDEDCTVHVDETTMYQVISNLIGNAVKFTSANGCIVASVHCDMISDRVTLKIVDDGIGISEEFLTHLFDPFERDRNNSDLHTEGSGLGLSITKRFVELMGGSIHVESKLGAGSTFYVHLPRVKNHIV